MEGVLGHPLRVLLAIKVIYELGLDLQPIEWRVSDHGGEQFGLGNVLQQDRRALSVSAYWIVQ